MVERVEELGLDGVEVGEGEEQLEPRVLQRGHRQRLEIQQVRGRRVAFREDQMLERDRRVDLEGQMSALSLICAI